MPVPFRLGGIACSGASMASWRLEPTLAFRSTGGSGSTIGEVKQALHRTVTRRSDEPKLEIGDAISMEEGVVGVVLARYTRSGDVRNDVHYVVELRGETDDKA
jgi:hypothetical protein